MREHLLSDSTIKHSRLMRATNRYAGVDANRRSFRLGDWRVYPHRNLLVGKSGEVRIEPKVMQVLELLAEQPGAVVGRDAFLTGIWDGRAATDEPLTRCIAELRRALGDSPSSPDYIQTIPKKGYRLVCAVEKLSARKPGESIRYLLPAAAAVIAAAAAGYILTKPPDSIEIAVLSLKSQSAAPEERHNRDFAYGLRATLNRIPEFNVRGDITTRRIVARTRDITVIANDLNLDYVVGSSLDLLGSNLVGSLRVYDRHGERRWSVPVEGNTNQLFLIQQDAAEKVAALFDVDWQPQVEHTRPAPGIEAYRQYLIGKASPLEPGVPVDETKAVIAFKSALALDPLFADIYPALAQHYALDCWGSDDRRNPSCKLAIDLANRGLELDPTLSEGLATLALVYAMRYDYFAAQSAIDRFHELPYPRITSDALPSAYLLLGHLQDAWNAANELYDSDPLNPMALLLMTSWSHLLKQDMELTMHYDQLWRSVTGMSLLAAFPEARMGMISMEQAIEEARQVLPMWKLSPDIAELWVRPHYDPSFRAQAVAGLRDLYERGDLRPTVFWMSLIDNHETDEAIDMAFQLYDEDLLNQVQLWIQRPGQKEIRSHPRFIELMEYVGLADYWDEHGWPDFCDTKADDRHCGLDIRIQ